MNTKSRAGQPYRPSNGTEGEGFTSEFCDQCIHQNPDPQAGKNCDILCRSLCYDLKDKEYPHEWQYNSLGYPTCTAFVNWNWGEDGDPDDPDNPKAPPPPPDPRQLNLFPLYPTELVLTSPPNELIENRPGYSNHKIHSQKAKAEG